MALRISCLACLIHFCLFASLYLALLCDKNGCTTCLAYRVARTSHSLLNREEMYVKQRSPFMQLGTLSPTSNAFAAPQTILKTHGHTETKSPQLKQNPIKTSRLLKISYKVKNLERSIRFYKEILGLKATYTTNATKATLTYFPDSVKEMFAIELIEETDFKGNFASHEFLGLGIHLNNIDFINAKEHEINELGGKIRNYVETRLVTPSLFPDENAKDKKTRKNAFIFDPDGYGIELVEEVVKDPLHRIRFYTTNLKEASFFYEDILGMNLVRHESHLGESSYPWDEYGGMSKYFSFGTENETDATLVQIAYAYDEDKIIEGNGFQYITMKARNMLDIEAWLKVKGWEFDLMKQNQCEPDALVVIDSDGMTIRFT